MSPVTLVFKSRVHNPGNAGPGVNKQQQRVHIRYFHFHSIQLATVSAVRWNTSPYTSPVHSFQLHAYEQGTHAGLNQIHDDLRALRRECDDALRDLKTKPVSGVQRWTSESQRCVLCHVSPLVLRLHLNSRQADRVLIVVRHTSAARVYKFIADPRVRCRTLTKLS